MSGERGSGQDKVRAQEELREQKRRLSALLGSLPVVAYRCSDRPGWTMEYLSDGCRSLTGHDPGELVGDRETAFEELILAEDRDASRAEIHRAVATDGMYAVTYRIRRADGAVRWIWDRGRAVGREGGETVLEGYLSDVTDRVAAERALLESERRYRTVFEESADAMLLIRSDRFVGCNAAAERLFGCGRGDIVGRAPAEFSPPLQPDGRDSAAAAADVIARAMLGETLRFDWQHRAAGGRPIDCEVSLTAIEAGGERLVHTTIRDVTERRRDQARITRLTRLYRVLSAAGEAIARTHGEAELYQALCDVFVEEGEVTLAWAGLLTPGGRVEPVARAGRELDYLEDLDVVAADEPRGRGTTGRSVRSGRVEVCNDVAGDPRMASWREESARRGLLASCSVPLLRGGKTLGALSLYWDRPGYLQDEEIALMERLAGDVAFALEAFSHERRRAAAETDLRRLSARLERLVEERTAELAAANRELEAFNYSVSHDLRAPLRAIDGFSRALQEDCGESLPAEGRAHLDRVRAATRRMSGLIDDLLQLSRVTGTYLLRVEVDLSAMAASVAVEIAERYPGVDAQFRVTPGVTAQADPSLLRIVLQNLLDNAWKFSVPTGRPVIDVGASDRSGEPVFCVRDNGVGFDLAHAERLCTPFQRYHSPGEFEGSGIGLATVQRIVLRHGGRVWAESAPGEGAVFFFTLGSEVA
jgi:PAS domain S-box-containing protein